MGQKKSHALFLLYVQARAQGADPCAWKFAAKAVQGRRGEQG